MNLDEVRAMCIYISRMVPHQQFDDATPQAWAQTLAGVDVADARAVIGDVLAREPYVAPNAIVAAVRRLRRDRLAAAGFDTICPNVDPADAPRYAAERRALRDAIASGQMDSAAVTAYEAGEVAPLTGGQPYAVAALESGRPGGVAAILSGKGVPA